MYLSFVTYLSKCSYQAAETLVLYTAVMVPLYQNVGTPVLKLWYLSIKGLNIDVSQYRRSEINKLSLNKNLKVFGTHSATPVNIEHKVIHL